MDPWLLGHLRLAEARGSLVAPNSIVQDTALQILLSIKDRDAQKARLDQVRVAIGQTGSFGLFPGLFPDLFGDDPFGEAKQEDGTYDIDKVDDAKVPWAVPDEQADEELSNWISTHSHGVVSGDDLDENGWV